MEVVVVTVGRVVVVVVVVVVTGVVVRLNLPESFLIFDQTSRKNQPS